MLAVSFLVGGGSGIGDKLLFHRLLIIVGGHGGGDCRGGIFYGIGDVFGGSGELVVSVVFVLMAVVWPCCRRRTWWGRMPWWDILRC